MIHDQLRAGYDAVPYELGAFRRTHPDNLSVIGALAGISAPAVPTCRVLEIGCATGGNLLPMAQALPEARFFSIDLSPNQIDAGVSIIRQLGFTNIELRCQNILDFSPDAGSFDYIIAHGVYSWVPREVRDKLLEIVARHLAPNGLAYVSYNTLPGWHLRQVFRDLTQFHARRAREDDIPDRISRAREMIAFSAGNV